MAQDFRHAGAAVGGYRQWQLGRESGQGLDHPRLRRHERDKLAIIEDGRAGQRLGHPSRPEQGGKDLGTGSGMAEMGLDAVVGSNARFAQLLQHGIVIGQVGVPAFKQDAVAIVDDAINTLHADFPCRRQK